MYELIRVSEHDYYIDCPSKIGLVLVGDGEVVAIDSGNSRETGKKVLRVLEGEGWRLRAIYATHSHADHIGACRFLEERTGCRIFAPGIEAAFTRDPLLEPTTLYGGYPPKELRTKFLLAESSDAIAIGEGDLPEGFSLIPLPGHSFGMAGYKTPDGNIYIGDALTSHETLEKYAIGYLWNPRATCETLEAMKNLQGKRFIPAHGVVLDDLSELIDENLRSIEGIFNTVESLCDGKSFDDILAGLTARYGIVLNEIQFALIGSALRSYLSCLSDEGRVGFTFENGRMLWRKK